MDILPCGQKKSLVQQLSVILCTGTSNIVNFPHQGMQQFGIQVDLDLYFLNLSEEFPIHGLKMNQYKYKRNGERYHQQFIDCKQFFFTVCIQYINTILQLQLHVHCILSRKRKGPFTCKLIKGGGLLYLVNCFSISPNLFFLADEFKDRRIQRIQKGMEVVQVSLCPPLPLSHSSKIDAVCLYTFFSEFLFKMYMFHISHSFFNTYLMYLYYYQLLTS